MLSAIWLQNDVISWIWEEEGLSGMAGVKDLLSDTIEKTKVKNDFSPFVNVRYVLNVYLNLIQAVLTRALNERRIFYLSQIITSKETVFRPAVFFLHAVVL